MAHDPEVGMTLEAGAFLFFAVALSDVFGDDSWDAAGKGALMRMPKASRQGKNEYSIRGALLVFQYLARSNPVQK